MNFKENENKQFINLERRQIKILSGYGRKTSQMLNCETWNKIKTSSTSSGLEERSSH